MILKHALSKSLKEWAAKEGIEIDIWLHNNEVNWAKIGCSGHVINKTTGSCAYVNTEPAFDGKVFYRLARDVTDYSSTSLINGYNRWCENDVDELAWKIIRMLAKEEARGRDER